MSDPTVTAAPRRSFKDRVNDFSQNWDAVVLAALKFVIAPVWVPMKALYQAIDASLPSTDFMSRTQRAIVNDGDPFRLKIYGLTLLNDSVKKQIGGYTMLLAFSLAFELFAWGSLWYLTGITQLGFWGWVSYLTLAVIFPGMVVLLDRGILTMNDPGTKKRLSTIFGRMALILGLSVVTSAPTEMVVFNKEITYKIETEQQEDLERIRTQLQDAAKAESDNRIAASAAALGSKPTDLVARRQVDRDSRARLLKEKSDELAAEVAGKVGSGKTGDGPAAKSLRAQEAELRRDLLAYEAETERLRVEAEGGLTSERAAHQAVRDEDLRAIDAMTGDELLASRNGAKRPDGFLTRFRVLQEIVHEPDASGNGGLTSNEMVVWGCRLVMVVFGIATLFIKFVMTTPETKAYYSPASQAFAGNTAVMESLRTLALDGNEEAMVTLERLGYNIKSWSAGWSEEVRSFHQNLFAARFLLANALVTFREQFRVACMAHRFAPGGGLVTPPYTELSAQALQLWWTDVVPLIQEVEAQEFALTNKGLYVPAWPKGFAMGDPRTTTPLWEQSNEELEKQFGWVDPDRLEKPFVAKAS